MNRTKTWVVNVRVDIRTLATLMKFYQHQGLASRHKSIAIRLATEHFKSIVTSQYPQFETPTFEEAVHYLEEQRILDLQEDFAGKYSLVKELQKESLDLDLRPTTRQTKHGMSADDHREMLEMLDRKLKQTAMREVIPNEQTGKEEDNSGSDY